MTQTLPRRTPPSGGAGVSRTATLSPERQRLRATLLLPEKPSQPSTDPGDYTWMIYGEKKIGKTSLAARFPDAFFLMFEPGGKSLEIFQAPINTWLEFVTYLDMLEEDDKFQTVVIDTIDAAYQMCFRYVCEREGFKHPTDAGYGKGWDAIKNEWNEQFQRLLKLGRGVVLLSHSKEEEVTSIVSNELAREQEVSYQKIVPSLANAGKELIKAAVDTIAYYGYFGKERFLVIRGNEFLNAGTRCEKNFLTPDGQQVQAISMGNSPDDAYLNFMSAFHNLQEDPNGKSQRPDTAEKKKPMANK